VPLVSVETRHNIAKKPRRSGGSSQFQAIDSSRRAYIPLPAPAQKTQDAQAGGKKRESGWERYCCYLVDRDAGNLTSAVASAPGNDPQKIEIAQISEPWQCYWVEATPEIYVATKLHKAARRSRPVRVNQELEKRTGLIVLSNYLDRILGALNRRKCESRCLSRYVGIEDDA
jgi:hypothetical protein